MTAACLKDDLAGGALIPSQSTVYFNGKLVIVDGDDVTPHGIGLHGLPPAKMIGTSMVKIGGKSIVKTGDTATCGHSATGSSTVIIG